MIPSSGNVNWKQHSSFNNFNKLGSFNNKTTNKNKPGVSCKFLL